MCEGGIFAPLKLSEKLSAGLGRDEGRGAHLVLQLKKAPLTGCHSAYRSRRAKPRRDHRFLARWSRHEVPMTPGYRIYALYVRPR